MTTRTEPGAELTDSELTIVRLVAMARSNQDIARELSIPVRTVETHLRNIYAKTGTNNRVQISNWLIGGTE